KNSLERTNEVIIRKRETRFVPSASGKTVLTDYVLDLYRHWFEESATSVQNMFLWNVNEDGAEINGIPSLSPSAAKEKLNSVKEHNYPWRELAIWSGENRNQNKTEKQKGNLGIGKKEELDLLIQNGSERLFQKIKTDLSFIESKLNDFEGVGIMDGKEETKENPISFQDSEIWLWMQSESYLRRLVRKTEIYLLRHKDLDRVRKNQILLQSIRKEIRYLKRSLYPMMDSFPEKG
ncbi:hypothetical protein EHQ79_14960, partial [Leptospira jelokensis]